MTRTLTLAAVAALISTSAFAMVPSNDSIKKDIMDLGFTASEVAEIPADQLQFLNFALNAGDDSDARQGARAAVASVIYDGGVSADAFAAWDANNGRNGEGSAKTAGVDFTPNATGVVVTGSLGGSEAN